MESDGREMVLSLLPNEDAVDPDKVHVMTDEEIFQERVLRNYQVCLEVDVEVINAGISFMEGIKAGIIQGSMVRSDEPDFHTRNASEIFGVPYDQVTPEQREIAKRKSFIETYGNHGWPSHIMDQFKDDDV
jgi:hypothetical protein